MKAAEFQVVADARRAAQSHMSFFNSMLQPRTQETPARVEPPKANSQGHASTAQKDAK